MPAPVTDREARLAAALRENLKRRKAQARARADGDARARADGDARARADGDARARAAQPANGRNPPEGAIPPPETDDDAPKDR